MAYISSLRQKHNLVNESAFHVKVLALKLKRFAVNSTTGLTPKFAANNSMASAPVIASSESELWNADDNDSNRILTAGKVENLRVATRKLSGIEVKAGEIFSFWKHIGIPSKSRGYMVGREIREGCIVPTIAGGLCQLSNALYDAALKAGFEIIERHKHTQVIKGSLAEYDRDATVKWNYVDLRFRAAFDFKIEIDFTADKFIVLFRSDKQATPAYTDTSKPVPSSKLNDCYSCGNTLCFKHPGDIVPITQKQITTFILDEKWPEYEQYIRATTNNADHFLVPFTGSKRFNIGRYTWQPNDPRKLKTFSFKALQRAASIRLAAKSNGNIPAVYLKYDKAILMALKNAIPVESTHIVIAQNLLPFAWQQGILWGRTFDVLMTRLPIGILQQKLDAAHSKYRDSKTLNDFRADEELIALENIALTKARHIITPHMEIASIFTHKAIKLSWAKPAPNNKSRKEGNKILFPASALARKGAYEIKRLAAELNLDLVISGSAVENDGFWNGINITPAGSNIFDDIKLVVLPSYIEHQPRLLLKALSLNIPVIATAACGLPEMENLTLIPVGEYEALKDAVQAACLVEQYS